MSKFVKKMIQSSEMSLVPSRPPLVAVIKRRERSGQIPPEKELLETGAFTMEGDVTSWAGQNGQGQAKLSITDPMMNAWCNQANGENITLNLPDQIAQYIPPYTRLRITVEVL